MVNDALQSFKSIAPQKHVSADQLDHNFNCVTLTEHKGDSAPYFVEVSASGTRIVPAQKVHILGDDGKIREYTIVGEPGGESRFAPPESGTYVWGSKDGVLQWLETSECED